MRILLSLLQVVATEDGTSRWLSGGIKVITKLGSRISAAGSLAPVTLTIQPLLPNGVFNAQGSGTEHSHLQGGR